LSTQLQQTTDGAILFDAAVAAQGGFDADWFEADYWRARSRAEDIGAGRGGATYLDASFGRCVLRHYHRGGMVARVMGDRYLWTGPERTRSFAEFRLLTQLRERGLRVPVPVAARYRRQGAYYRADLITRRIEAAATLADLLRRNGCDADVAARVGAAIAEFHAAGVYHADLNAHNILVVAEAVWLVDFDRGQLRAPAIAWQRANLARLQRSMHKVLAGGPGLEGRAGILAFDDKLWNPLLAAYERRMDELDQARPRGVRA
jgi:3-deoxy-D-manno-octulosonic acid kinase